MKTIRDPGHPGADHEGFVVTDEEIPVRRCSDCGMRNKTLAKACHHCGKNLSRSWDDKRTAPTGRREKTIWPLKQS
jgi:hypothetical protein